MYVDTREVIANCDDLAHTRTLGVWFFSLSKKRVSERVLGSVVVA